ncbi:hypothetical protein [uncultured Acinetobacter sp.]|uniref:hypothetical protein n=1 Tax=uncultured Acinetobacter sp. TaxID=165433 RepID=UPI00258D4958|nr:hypothetical protein [uncultured Acinetobacter sp.]
MNAVAEKFEQFEWLTHGITAKSPQFNDETKGTGDKPLDYQDRLGAIASLDTPLEKAITSIVIFGENAKGDYDFLLNHLAGIMVKEAAQDGKKDPDKMTLKHLASLIARMVLDFAINPAMEDNFTAKGRLYYAGIGENKMNYDAYRKSWKQYETMMILSIEGAIKCASEGVEKYRKQTYKDVKN